MVGVIPLLGYSPSRGRPLTLRLSNPWVSDYLFASRWWWWCMHSKAVRGANLARWELQLQLKKYCSSAVFIEDSYPISLYPFSVAYNASVTKLFANQNRRERFSYALNRAHSLHTIRRTYKPKVKLLPGNGGLYGCWRSCSE